MTKIIEVEENVNDRLKEELTIALVQDLKMARQAEGVLTLREIARAINEAMGDDAPNLAGLLYVLNSGNIKTKSAYEVENKMHEFIFNSVKNNATT